MRAAQVLAGRREGELLAFPSVQRMAEILTKRCREQSWVRTSVASLERFRAMTGNADLELLREQALLEPARAEEALRVFAAALAGYTESQVSALTMGAKIWFRLNGVAVPWRPLPGVAVSHERAAVEQQGTERVVLLALIGSGLCMSELLRLRLGDVGSLDGEGQLIPDIEADPLAVRFTPRRGKQGERITFFTYQTRQALLSSLAERSTDANMLDSLLIQPMTSTRSITRARQRSRALIEAGNKVNVELCMTTGNFFRDWGLPGSRFEGPEDYNIEEFV